MKGKMNEVPGNDIKTGSHLPSMKAGTIAEVGIDEEGRLYLRPETADFPLIYREAVDVHWEPSRRHLHSPQPREWTYLRWFQQIIHATEMQAYNLHLTSYTAWVNVPAALSAEMQHWFATRTPELR